MKRKKLFFFAGVACCLLLAAWGYHLYCTPRKTAAEQSADVRIAADKLYDAYASDEQTANRQYLDKIIEVTGVVIDVQQVDKGWGILLTAGPGKPGGVNCSLVSTGGTGTMPGIGKKVVIKGKCAGFLADVNITDAVLLQ
ncbi:MAG: hypothetical protein QM731_28985 [Chitinophagaceae bacterium]